MQSYRDFKAFSSLLRRRYGNLFRAWRKLLDPDGSMLVTRREFFSACRELQWQGDCGMLWHALDADDSGRAALEEFASFEARTLGVFKQWMMTKYGDTKTCVRSLNTIKGGKTSKSASLNKGQWIEACGLAGFTGDAGGVFDLLDWECDGKVTAAEVQCLGKWPSPAEWLLAEPNPRAAQAFKDYLLKKYHHFLKAWCLGIDVSSTSRVSWDDFKRACAKMHFKDDLAGCWAAMDTDHSGVITLREIDPVSAAELARFRCFAVDEWGSVMLAVEALDRDRSGSLSMREFMSGLTSHGFKGDIINLHKSLDFNESGRLSASELLFLDEWTLLDLLNDDVAWVAEEDDEEEFARRATVAVSEAAAKDEAEELKRLYRRRVLPYPRLPTAVPFAPWGPRGSSCPQQRPLPLGLRLAPRRCRAVTPLHEEVLAEIYPQLTRPVSSCSSMAMWPSRARSASSSPTRRAHGGPSGTCALAVASTQVGSAYASSCAPSTTARYCEGSCASYAQALVGPELLQLLGWTGRGEEALTSLLLTPPSPPQHASGIG